MRTRLSTLLLALCVPCVLALGCDSADNPVAPTGSVLTITASSSKIGLSGTVNLSITGFRPDGNRLPEGTQVRLETSLGVLSSNLVEIASDGYAQASLSADGKAGDATVTARLTTGDAEATVSIEIAENKPTLLVQVNPSTVRVLETAQVTITARDENSLPLGAGEEILLSSNAGTFADDAGLPVTSVLTGDDGRATVEFIAGTQAINSGEICALLRNSDEVCETIQVLDAPAAFTFTVDKNTVDAGGDSLVLSATVVNEDGLALSGTLVRFDSSKGGTFDPAASVTTGTSGQATTTITYEGTNLTSGETFSVSATVRIAGDDVTQSETITVQ